MVLVDEPGIHAAAHRVAARDIRDGGRGARWKPSEDSRLGGWKRKPTSSIDPVALLEVVDVESAFRRSDDQVDESISVDVYPPVGKVRGPRTELRSAVIAVRAERAVNAGCSVETPIRSGGVRVSELGELVVQRAAFIRSVGTLPRVGAAGIEGRCRRRVP